MIYDLFYVSKDSIADEDWNIFKQRFPTAQKIENAVSFEDIKKRAFTKLFWVVWDDLVVHDDFIFDYRVPKWDEQYIHVFKNGSHYNGVCLFPKSASVSKREYDFRFFNVKKEIDIVASESKNTNFDIVFISYNEPNADTNFQTLLSKVTSNKIHRVDGVKGIHQAHIAAANLATTDMFWVVDGDAIIVDNFNFNFNDPEKFTVHVWRSRNPINNLEYGYGGVKLLPRKLTLTMDVNSADMTTSISTKFKAVDTVSNITAFNTDPFNTWKSAFRECVKLSSKVINGQINEETQARLYFWCKLNPAVEFGSEAYRGAIAGQKYGEENKNNIEALKKINDFDWLMEKYNDH